jgi:tetraacyldisaccharide 4'-kinase
LQPVRRLRWPVISIGNLSTGGAGKTPFTIALAQALTRRGFHVDVLSRGYGRVSRKAMRVDPNGTAEQFGDEPIEIARATGLPVYVAAQRYEACVLAEAEWSADSPAGVHLLDDGFQHRQLHRDVDILLLSAADLNDKLLPAGNLREPLYEFRRATVLAIAGNEFEVERYLSETALIGRNNEGPRWIGPLWRFNRRMEVPHIGGPVIAFCGIARPEQFFQGLQNSGVQLAKQMVFADHYRYTESDIERLQAAARTTSATAFITTEKDRVRMGKLSATFLESCPLKTAELRVEIENEDAALEGLLNRLAPLLQHSGQ